MASLVAPPVSAALRDTSTPYRPTLTLLASLFFMWGFATVLNNTLLPHLRSVFDLSYTQATLIESVWFIAYFVASLPSARLIETIGYKRAMVTALLVMAAGGVLMAIAATIPSYTMMLAALFIIASGITLLQVAANPYVALVGPAQTTSARLNLVQAFNSLGTTLAPLFGGWLILGRSASGNRASGSADLGLAARLADAHAVVLPYVLVAAVLAALALVIACFPLPDLAPGSRRARAAQDGRSLWRHRNLVMGIPTMFVYLIAEIGVANLFISFVSQPDIGALTHAQAAHYLFLLWCGMMVGRFAGSLLMRRISPQTILAGASIGAFAVMLVAATATGHVAMWALISVGLFHSVMFPTIFTLGIKGLGPLTEEGSGLLIMSIAGGALVVAQGWLADRLGIQRSFVLTVGCELCVLLYATWGCRVTNALPDEAVQSVTTH